MAGIGRTIFSITSSMQRTSSTKSAKPNIRMQFDFYHVQIVGGDLIHRLEKFLPLIGHLQCAAVPSRHEPDEGEINYPAVFEAVDKLGYTRAGSAPNIGRAGAPKMAWAGPQIWRGAAR